MTRPRDIADSINRINSSAADATAVTIDSSEQVGIGTTSPDTLLNLESAAPTIRLAPTTQNNSASIELGVLNSSTNAYAKIDSHNTTNYDSNIRFFTNAAGSTTQVERMRILSSGGITFNGDTATANALDDYEEGSWTPAITQGFTGISSYDTQVGFYTKIGNTVRAYFRLEMGGNGTANSNGVIVGNLPYTSLNNAHVYTTGTHYINVAAAGGENSFPLVFPNSSGVTLYVQNATGVTPLSGSTAGNSLDVLGQVIYESA